MHQSSKWCPSSLKCCFERNLHSLMCPCLSVWSRLWGRYYFWPLSWFLCYDLKIAKLLRIFPNGFSLAQQLFSLGAHILYMGLLCVKRHNTKTITTSCKFLSYFRVLFFFFSIEYTYVYKTKIVVRSIAREMFRRWPNIVPSYHLPKHDGWALRGSGVTPVVILVRAMFLSCDINHHPSN